MNFLLRRGESFTCLLLLVGVLCGAGDTHSLPSYHVDLTQTTVSGLSSGAFMAGQFAVAHSAIVCGAGLVAGGPYYCAGYPDRGPFTPYLANALSVCMTELADTNNMIVLYPQVEPNAFYPYNPRGCRDFWGYSRLDLFAPDYYTRNGVQIRAVRAMLERLAQPRNAPEP